MENCKTLKPSCTQLARLRTRMCMENESVLNPVPVVLRPLPLIQRATRIYPPPSPFSPPGFRVMTNVKLRVQLMSQEQKLLSSMMFLSQGFEENDMPGILPLGRRDHKEMRHDWWHNWSPSTEEPWPCEGYQNTVDISFSVIWYNAKSLMVSYLWGCRIL